MSHEENKIASKKPRDLREADLPGVRFAWYDTEVCRFMEFSGHLVWAQMCEFEADYTVPEHGVRGINEYEELAPKWAFGPPPEQPQSEEPPTEQEVVCRCVQRLTHKWMEDLDMMGKRENLLVTQLLLILSAVLTGISAWGIMTRQKHEQALRIMEETSDPFKGRKPPDGLM